MADLSLLFSRGAPHFSRDARFDDAEPDLSSPVVAPAPLPAIDPLAAAHASGFAEGMATARAEALAQAEAERSTAERFAVSLARLDAERTETLRQRLLDTVVALCEATLAPLALDIPALARRVERAAAMFVRADDERVIRLNPDDLASVQHLLPPDWTTRGDPTLERGALRVETVGGGVEDGPALWRHAIAEALDLC